MHTEESESCQPPHTVHTVFACLNADACLFVFAGVHHIMPALTGQCLNAAGVGWLRRAFCGESFGNMRFGKTFRTLREDFLGRLVWDDSVGRLFGEDFLVRLFGKTFWGDFHRSFNKLQCFFQGQGYEHH